MHSQHPTSHVPTTVLERAPMPDGSEIAFAADLYREGLEIADPVDRELYLGEVAELVGDINVYEALATRITADREATLANIALIQDERANEAAHNIATQGFAFDAPSFSEQIIDTTRETPFIYAEDVKHGTVVENQDMKTEIEGLVELDGFLNRFLDQSRESDGTFRYPEMAVTAQSMLENLTFIGQKEYDEAVLGLQRSWKDYLDGDSNRQLVVVAGISGSTKYPGQRKSDDFLRDRILGTFTDQELVDYSGRIIDDVDAITASPEDTKVVLLDDWSITGSQLRREYAELSQDPAFQALARAGRVEIDLLASGESRLQNGLDMNPDHPGHDVVPVRAYFKAHPSDYDAGFGSSHITGLHSSVNYGFEMPINKGMVKILGKLGRLRRGELPIALANIVRPYRDAPQTVEITPTQLRRV